MSASIISTGTTTLTVSQKMDSVALVSKKDWGYSRVELYLDNVILTNDKISPSPSEKDGLDSMSEYDLRYIGCELIQTAGILLKLPQVAMATAQVLFQRFYYFKSFVNNPMEIFAMASLVLASKIEEAIRRNRDIINVFHYLKHKRANLPPEPLMLDGNYQYIKNQVIKAERKLLRELGFCVHVKHPHKLITCVLQALGCQRRRVLQTAWNYMNDGLRTNIFVRYSPVTIACACIYLSARQHKVVFPSQPPWFEVFKCTEDQLKDVAVNIMYVYVHQPQPQQLLEEKILNLKEQQAEAKTRARTAGLQLGLNNNNHMVSTSTTSTSNSTTNHHQQNMNSSNNSGSHSHNKSSNQSPYSNSRNTSPSARDQRKDKKSRKRRSRSPASDPDDSGDSASQRSRGNNRGYKHQKKSKHSRGGGGGDQNNSSNYPSNNNNNSLEPNSKGGDNKPRKHKHRVVSPGVAHENGHASSPPKRSRNSQGSSSGGTSSSPDYSGSQHIHKSKKHKRKSSRDKHKKTPKKDYKERSSRYY
ncbi:cyclin-L1-like [Symsagittifera roscoffensis]|uniref:cyclin-L1-like n=1 Tax=Symsagittifera roscoffensis TaxID=84072 RepID=UPI00307C11CF